ncbi:ribonuclease Z [Methanocella paludicola SANAE]|uniref:Ribonuclease Z n=1 Tax=Methanocella paludicola (strain DSM 17711 / JCM 13418 / NBRC 101707 / SANAE) TaxID=304371 RepID=D1Z2I6_METPS|nr:ribonuclease Z [Methanocella paludicola]BAI62908.1 ribonuclease Z [Methanocella paludicola SANAE]
MLKVIFLGTGGSVPSPCRGMPSLMVVREGERMLFDCGEGTQRQMMCCRSGFMDVGSIFLTHFHADHTLGIPGLIQTMGFQGRTEPLHIYGPKFVREYCDILNSLGYLKPAFDVVAHELRHGDVVERNGYKVEAFRTFHSVPGLGYALMEDARLGRFDRQRALELGVPEGPLFGRLHRGEDVEVKGSIIKSSDVVGEPRPGRRIVYTGDTAPSQAFLPVLKGADLWISEATFADEASDKAAETLHSSSGDVARLAATAGVQRLILTHISSRYSEDITPLLEDARKYFPGVVVAEDFMEVDVPLRE